MKYIKSYKWNQRRLKLDCLCTWSAELLIVPKFGDHIMGGASVSLHYSSDPEKRWFSLCKSELSSSRFISKKMHKIFRLSSMIRISSVLDQWSIEMWLQVTHQSRMTKRLIFSLEIFLAEGQQRLYLPRSCYIHTGSECIGIFNVFDIGRSTQLGHQIRVSWFVTRILCEDWEYRCMLLLRVAVGKRNETMLW